MVAFLGKRARARQGLLGPVKVSRVCGKSLPTPLTGFSCVSPQAGEIWPFLRLQLFCCLSLLYKILTFLFQVNIN